MPLIDSRRFGLSNFNRHRQEDYYSTQSLLTQVEMDDDSSSSSVEGASNTDNRSGSTRDSESTDSSDSTSSSRANSNSNNEDSDDDNTTITESFSRPRVDMYRLAVRSNSEILDDLSAIIRMLRQINALYRIFNNNNANARPSNSFTANLLGRRSTFLARNSNYYTGNSNSSSDATSDEDEEDGDDEEEANKLLEAGLEDLQEVLNMNDSENKRQSTLALLALITYQYNHCSSRYLSRYLDPNGCYDPTLAMFAAATYDDDNEIAEEPKSCRDIINAASDLYGPDWLNEFHKGKEGALRKMLEKLTFVAKIRLKVRDNSSNNCTYDEVIR